MVGSIVTPEFRAAFVGVFRATAMRDNPDGKKKYSLRAVFMPGTDITEMKKAAAQCVADKWGKNPPKNLRSPFRTNAELDNPIPGVEDDAIVMNFSAHEDRRPGVVDHRLQDIIDEAVVYPGCWMRADVRPYAYDAAGNRGVAFGLNHVQKLRDDKPLGAGRLPANKVFSAVENANSIEDIF